MNTSESYSKDALFLSELSCAEGPEVDMGFTTGDDVGAVAGVKLHSKHSLISTLQIQQHTRKHLLHTLTSILHSPIVTDWNKQTLFRRHLAQTVQVWDEIHWIWFIFHIFNMYTLVEL